MVKPFGASTRPKATWSAWARLLDGMDVGVGGDRDLAEAETANSWVDQGLPIVEVPDARNARHAVGDYCDERGRGAARV